MPVTEKPAANLSATVAIVILLFISFGAGGGGSRYGLANFSVQLAAIATLAAHYQEFARFWREAPFGLRGLIAASIALPLVQVVPIPLSMVSMLPGRDLVLGSLALANHEGWMPISVDPRRTLLALTALITPLAVLIVGWSLPRQRIFAIGWAVVGLGIATVLLGTVQLDPGGAEGTLFGARRPGTTLLGTFANRNSTGLFLVFGLTLAALLPAPRHHPAALPIRLAICALLLVAIILTKSRSALVLAFLPAGLGLIRALLSRLPSDQDSTKAISGKAVLTAVGTAALLSVGVAALVVSAPGRVGDAIERFEARDDPRRFIWEDATYAASRYWPVGAGIGTFDEVFQIDESLESLTKRRAGRAHNDYIEVAIEAGAFGIALEAAWLLLLGWMSWRVRWSPYRWAAWGGSIFLLATALQSITDYPLRNQTILAFAGFALLLLTRLAADRPADRS